MKSSKRKEDIKNLLLKKQVSSYGRIYQLIETGKLDKVIDKITDEKTNTIITSIVKKGYLTGNEQFLDVLANFISYFDRNFPTISYRDFMLESMFENDDVPEFLLCKKYWGDNDNIPYYTYEMKKFIVSNFRDTLFQTRVHLDRTIWKCMDQHLIVNLDDEKEVEWLFDKMKQLCWTNINNYSLIYLFSNWNKSFIAMEKIVKRQGKDMLEASIRVNNDYGMHLEMLFDNYLKNKKILKDLKNIL